MSRKVMSRRRFLGVSGMFVAASTADACWFFRRRRRCRCHPARKYVRQNIASLQPAQLQSLKKGVEVMKSRDDDDPTSWRFQANIHGTFDPPQPLFNQCEHGTIQFLTWHRAYLYFFERILRKASGDPSLTLPYWNWNIQRSLPLAFREPAVPGNPLFDDTRSINDGSELPENVVVDDLELALEEIEFRSGFTGFSPQFEGSPHGAVHVLVGGNMRSVPTAANDPIFWLHHGNIDRVWDQWLNLNAGRMNPSDPGFLNQEYSFADENGATVTVKVNDIISSAGLGYCYDDVPNPPMFVSGTEAAGKSRVVASSVKGLSELTPPEDAEPISLGFEKHSATVPVLKDGAAALRESLSEPQRAAKVLLDIQGITIQEVPNFTFGVYVNLPKDEMNAKNRRLHYAGSINFFGRGHKKGHPHRRDHVTTFTQTFNVTRVINHLRKSTDWNDGEFSVTLVPVAPIAPKGQEDARKRLSVQSAEKAKISYQRIALRIVR